MTTAKNLAEVSRLLSVNANGDVTGNGGASGVFTENLTTLSRDYSISAGRSAAMVGPLTIATGKTLTIPTGSRLVVL